MSERWGSTCGKCNGTGEVRNAVSGMPETCFWCDGTGKISSGPEWPPYKEDHEKQMREAIEALNDYRRV